MSRKKNEEAKAAADAQQAEANRQDDGENTPVSDQVDQRPDEGARPADGDVHTEEHLPSHYDQGEAPGTDERLHGDGTVAASHDLPHPDSVPNSQSPDEPGAAAGHSPEQLGAVDPHAGDFPTPATSHFSAFSDPGDTVRYQPDHAELDARKYHEGYNQALRDSAVTRDGTQYVGPSGQTLAEALDKSDVALKDKLRALQGDDAQ